MIALLQRVRAAHVDVAGHTVGRIGPGLLVFVGVERSDTEASADRLLERVLGYRIFSDGQGKMNLSVNDVRGGLLLVPQFTLAADTRTGTRPGFTPAAPQADGERLFGYLLGSARARFAPVESGVFGADMQVTLTNDGPVTFWIEAR